MTIATVVTRGYGTFGSIAEVVTRGYSIPAVQTSRGDLGMTEEEYNAYLRQLRARRRKLEERRKRDKEALRKLVRSAAGLEVEPEAVTEALEAIRKIDAPTAAQIESTPSAARLAAAEAKLKAIEARIRSIEAAIAEEDDEETLILLMH